MNATTSQWRTALEAEYEARATTWSDIQGHLPFLLEQAAATPGGRLLELGVRSGNSTAALLLAAERAGGHLWSVDLEAPQAPSWWALTGRWTFLQADDLDPATLEQLGGGFALVLIDTSHTYDHTLAELRAYVPLVRPGGMVCCHDVELVGHDARGYGITGPSGPVRRALDDYCAETGLAWTERPGSFGLGVMRMPEAPPAHQPGPLGR
jgi:predicted O-methyltransferase YrrM